MGTKKMGEIYKCNICGNIIEVLFAGGSTPVCDGQPMELLVEKTSDVGLEKHVPIIEKTDNGFKVKVGQVPHPMEAKHYIMWVQLIADDKRYSQLLKPGAMPEAEFNVTATNVVARIYCNLHGLWRSK